MAVTAAPYGAFLLALGRGQLNIETNTIKVVLATGVYVPNADTHDFLDDVTGTAGAEVNDPSYTAGGQELQGKSWAYDATNNQGVLTGNPVLWPNANFSTRYAVLHVPGADAATSRLIGYVDFGEDRTYVNTDAQLSFPNGVIRLRAL